MRKLAILLLLGISFLLVGCQSKTVIALTVDSSLTETIIVTSTELADMKTNGDTFILYISSETCSGCNEFEPYLEEYINTYHIPVYQILIDSSFPQENDLYPYQYTPTLLIIVDGILVKTIDAVYQDTVFESYDALDDYLTPLIDFKN